MSNLTTMASTDLAIWDDPQKLQEIRKLFAPTLTDMEFQFFVGLGKATRLNPFLREIWCVKYGKDKDGKESPAQVYIGRDGYRKAAQNHAEYDYHQADAVYENDKFEVVNGDVRHSYTLANRGKLIGAYCVAKRHKSSKPQYVFAELEEYTTGQSLWADVTWKENKYGGKFKVGGKPATMIKKVAESQCLRAAFQDLLGGTYGEEEYDSMKNDKIIEHEPRQTKSDALMDKLKAAKGKTIEPIDITPEPEEELGEEETGEVATDGQLKELHKLIAAKRFNNGRLTKAMEHYGIETLAELTKQQAMDFMAKLHRIETE